MSDTHCPFLLVLECPNNTIWTMIDWQFILYCPWVMIEPFQQRTWLWLKIHLFHEQWMHLFIMYIKIIGHKPKKHTFKTKFTKMCSNTLKKIFYSVKHCISFLMHLHIFNSIMNGSIMTQGQYKVSLIITTFVVVSGFSTVYAYVIYYSRYYQLHIHKIK
jgi:hypothetical protein